MSVGRLVTHSEWTHSPAHSIL